MPNTKKSSTIASHAEFWTPARIAALRLALTQEALHQAARVARGERGYGLPAACLYALAVSTPENVSERAAKLAGLLRCGSDGNGMLWKRLCRRMRTLGE